MNPGKSLWALMITDIFKETGRNNLFGFGNNEYKFWYMSVKASGIKSWKDTGLAYVRKLDKEGQ